MQENKEALSLPKQSNKDLVKLPQDISKEGPVNLNSQGSLQELTSAFILTHLNYRNRVIHFCCLTVDDDIIIRAVEINALFLIPMGQSSGNLD
jgi:hypothetical protein